MRLYYLVASLPALAFGEVPPLTTAELVAHCRRFLTAVQVAELEQFLEADSGGSDREEVRTWYDREIQIRNRVARWRAARRGVDPSPHLRPHGGDDVWLDREVEQALARPDPLARELALDRLRFELAEDLARAEPFGLAAVLAYGRKLQILQRWAATSDEAGFERLGASLRHAGAGG